MTLAPTVCTVASSGTGARTAAGSVADTVGGRPASLRTTRANGGRYAPWTSTVAAAPVTTAGVSRSMRGGGSVSDRYATIPTPTATTSAARTAASTMLIRPNR